MKKKFSYVYTFLYLLLLVYNLFVAQFVGALLSLGLFLITNPHFMKSLKGKSPNFQKASIFLQKMPFITLLVFIGISILLNKGDHKIPPPEQQYIDTVLVQITSQTTKDDAIRLLGKPSRDLVLKVNWWVSIDGRESRVGINFSPETGKAESVILGGGWGRFCYVKELATGLENVDTTVDNTIPEKNKEYIQPEVYDSQGAGFTVTVPEAYKPKRLISKKGIMYDLENFDVYGSFIRFTSSENTFGSFEEYIEDQRTFLSSFGAPRKYGKQGYESEILEEYVDINGLKGCRLRTEMNVKDYVYFETYLFMNKTHTLTVSLKNDRASVEYSDELSATLAKMLETLQFVGTFNTTDTNAVNYMPYTNLSVTVPEGCEIIGQGGADWHMENPDNKPMEYVILSLPNGSRVEISSRENGMNYFEEGNDLFTSKYKKPKNEGILVEESTIQLLNDTFQKLVFVPENAGMGESEEIYFHIDCLMDCYIWFSFTNEEDQLLRDKVLHCFKLVE